ncbi:MAG TPA: sigma 54-interacting transcriptional regulator [Polyangiaceae bacterium]|nr:sigma 54-interacting transcriptional regulator [Polyangiaceae bacterium]
MRAESHDTTAPNSSLPNGASARIQQLHVVYAPEDEDSPGDRHRKGALRAAVDADELVLGREPEGPRTLVLTDRRVSRNHAAVIRNRATGEVDIVDRRSRHGTIVGGKPVDRAKLTHGSVIRLGRTILVYTDTLLRMDEAKALAPETAALRGTSLAMQRLRGEIALVAPRTLPVLILGETGVGKERAAHEIHRQSGRCGPFVAVNCAAIAPTLAEAELFGHAQGAFTGATQKNEGLFVAADKGTLFLDEIAELPAGLQPKLLRALATGEIRALGRTEPRFVDVRIVAATHGDLEGAVTGGGFRGDLLARLAGWIARIPALRERREDILGLAQFFLQREAPRTRLSSACAEALVLYDWPFNVRELEQVLAAATIRAREGTIRIEHLPESIAGPVLSRAPAFEPDAPAPLLQALVPPDAPPDAAGLLRVVRAHHGNVAQVAAYFGKDRKQIYRWAEKLGVDIESVRDADDGNDA